jgi:hypothetical protein
MPYKPGDHYVVCSVCGFRYYRSECRKNWKGQIVCSKCYDGPRDPLDFPPPLRRDRVVVRDARPEGNLKATIIETVAPTSITSTTAASGGNITNDGGASVTAYGVCWSTATAPTLDDSYTEDGTGAEEFTSALTGLTANTKYYVRAYATNAVGTAYGPTQEFTTLP